MQERGTRSSCRIERDTVGLPTTVCRLCGEREESVPHVLSECRELANVGHSGWASISLNDILWHLRAMQQAGDQAPVLTSVGCVNSSEMKVRMSILGATSQHYKV
ncbi:hypothetical protein PoB_006996900 [Plakobranchus ocellatus]|uniref:Reverse transcriptase zinc-binding domain-containing protein n=1 Tax=Plakobranchus ocellatus TaxID=259542 RepID=A0AAV4DH22_9GAST|nr:hypothetical protein PoB_006996900 [Plakobranchus ocellatus]